MGAISLVFEVLTLAGFFAAFSSWSFKYVFNHDIIRNYAHRTHFSKADINSVLDRQINAKYGCRLLRLEVDDEQDTEENISIPGLAGPYNQPVNSPYGAESPSVGMPRSEKSRTHYTVGVLFSILVTLSLELVLLLMIQLFASVELNLAVFRFVIMALVVLATIVQPPMVILLYVNQKIMPALNWKSPTAVFKLALTVVLCALWFLVLSRFGALAHALGPDAGKLFLEEKTNEIVLAGISITAVLSGVGCMLTPIRRFWIDGVLKTGTGHASSGLEEMQLNELIQSYNSTKMLKRKRQAELNRHLLKSGGTVYGAPETNLLRLLKGSGKHFLNRMQSFTSFLTITGSDSEEDELRREISSLELFQDLIYADLSKKLDAFLRARETSAGHSSRLERALAVGNLLFSLYCIYRIVNVLFLRLPYHFFWSGADLHRETNIIDDGETSEALNKNTKDALAITIAKIIQGLFGYLPMSETQLINQVSFILSGSLFACSFQNVLVTFKSLGRLLPTNTTAVNANVKTWIKHLIVSEFMAIYVIATALLIRSNLPPEIATLMLKILSLTPTSSPTSSAQMMAEVDFIDAWFDKVFGATCVVTFLVIAMRLFIENDNIYEGGYDEEMIVEDNSSLKLS